MLGGAELSHFQNAKMVSIISTIIIPLYSNFHLPFQGGLLLFVFHGCHVFLFASCSLVVTCLERAELLALLYEMFYCVFVTFKCGVLCQV